MPCIAGVGLLPMAVRIVGARSIEMARSSEIRELHGQANGSESAVAARRRIAIASTWGHNVDCRATESSRCQPDKSQWYSRPASAPRDDRQVAPRFRRPFDHCHILATCSLQCSRDTWPTTAPAACEADGKQGAYQAKKGLLSRSASSMKSNSGFIVARPISRPSSPCRSPCVTPRANRRG